MESLLEAFFRGGSVMYLIVLSDLLVGPGALGVFALSLAARLLGKEGRIARALSILIGLASSLPLALGAVGFWVAQVQAETASLSVPPDLVDEVLATGYELGMLPLVFGGGSGALFLLIAATAFFLAPARGAWEQASAAADIPSQEQGMA
jgi:uncharacterized membrane protein YuzA (DUF378 family)